MRLKYYSRYYPAQRFDSRVAAICAFVSLLLWTIAPMRQRVAGEGAYCSGLQLVIGQPDLLDLLLARDLPTVVTTALLLLGLLIAWIILMRLHQNCLAGLAAGAALALPITSRDAAALGDIQRFIGEAAGMDVVGWLAAGAACLQLLLPAVGAALCLWTAARFKWRYYRLLHPKTKKEKDHEEAVSRVQGVLLQREHTGSRRRRDDRRRVR